MLAWAVAIYVPSGLVALAGMSPLAEGRSLPAATFAVADEVSPAAKIGYALLLGSLLAAAGRIPLGRPLRIATDVLIACAATLLMLALLPAGWSRGFGIGLGGARFDTAATAVYLAGAALSGFTFSLSEARCRGRGRRG